MALKRLTPDKIELVNKEIRNWLYNRDETTKHQVASSQWFHHVKRANTTYALLQTITGLSDTRLYDLIFNKTNTATYWLPDGTIRKDYSR